MGEVTAPEAQATAAAAHSEPALATAQDTQSKPQHEERLVDAPPPGQFIT